MEVAARFLDPVEHTATFTGALIGLGIGIAIGAAIVFAAPVTLTVLGVAAAVGTVAGTAVLGEKLGENGGKAVKSSNAGDIADGCHTVFTGETQAKQARMSDPLKCHSGQAIEQGSDSVFVANWNASRKGDATDCGGKIKDGCATVLIGGNPSNRPGYTHDEIPWQFRFFMTGLDWTSTVLGFLTGKGELKVGWELALQIVGTGSKAYGASSLPHAKEVGLVGGLVAGGGKGIRSLNSASKAANEAEAAEAAGDSAKAASLNSTATLNNVKAAQQGVSGANSLYGYFGSGPAPATH